MDFITTKHLQTIELLLQKLKEDTGFKNSSRLILKDLGFRWRKTQNNRKILIENEDIKEKRITYLRSLKRYREQN